MADLTIKKITDLSFYDGEHKRASIKFKYAGKDLGVTAWGMNVIDMQAGTMEYPDHDHEKDGQEEVYVVLEGSATLQADGQDYPIEKGMLVRVGPLQKRKFVPGPHGATLLAIGGTPGQAYPA